LNYSRTLSGVKTDSPEVMRIVHEGIQGHSGICRSEKRTAATSDPFSAAIETNLAIDCIMVLSCCVTVLQLKVG